MVLGIGNPLGYVPIFDNGVPRIIGGIARTNISGGAWVAASGAADAVGSQVASYITSDIQWVTDTGASGAAFTGVMIEDTGSNTNGAVVTKGAFIALCDGTVTAGRLVVLNGVNAVRDITGSFHAFNFPVGRALTGAGSEGYAIIQLGL